jgi:hypothetical protein
MEDKMKKRRREKDGGYDTIELRSVYNAFNIPSIKSKN